MEGVSGLGTSRDHASARYKVEMQSKRAPLAPETAKESNLRNSSSSPARGKPELMLNSELYEIKVVPAHLYTCRLGIQLGGQLSEKMRRKTDRTQINKKKSRIFPVTAPR